MNEIAKQLRRERREELRQEARERRRELSSPRIRKSAKTPSQILRKDQEADKKHPPRKKN